MGQFYVSTQIFENITHALKGAPFVEKQKPKKHFINFNKINFKKTKTEDTKPPEKLYIPEQMDEE